MVQEWLRKKYGDRLAQPQKYEVETRIIVVTPWLFGTFVASYPKEIPVGEPRKVEVTFTPAVFSGDLLDPKLQLRPARFGRGEIPQTLKGDDKDFLGWADRPRFRDGTMGTARSQQAADVGIQHRIREKGFARGRL